MLSRLASHRRHPAFWVGLSALVVAQLVAFYQLCSSQVRKAEDRRAAIVVEHVAHAACLPSDPFTTGTCAVPPATDTSRARGAAAIRPVSLPAR